MESKIIKSYKGFEIEKSWDIKADGTINKNTVIYTAYDDGDLFDSCENIAGLKKKIDSYL